MSRRRNRVQSTHDAADLSWAGRCVHGEPGGRPPWARAPPVIPVDDGVIGVVAAFAATAQAISGFGMNLILAPVMQVVAPGPAAVRLGGRPQRDLELGGSADRPALRPVAAGLAPGNARLGSDVAPR